MDNRYISLSMTALDDQVYWKSRRKSLWRFWNQLSRLQKSLVYIAVLLMVLSTLIYFRLYEVDEQEAIRNSKLKVVHRKREYGAVVVERIKSTEKTRVVESDLAPDDGIGQIPEPNIEAKVVKKDKPEKSTGLHFEGPTNPRQSAVVKAFLHSWYAYKNHSWGHDYLKPISKSYQDWFQLALTLVDSLDTMYIMGLKEEFNLARDYVDKEFNLDRNRDVNLFETTIRILGGLLSAYHLSGDKVFLEKAEQLGTRLMPCFKTKTGVPYSDVNLHSLKAHAPRWSPDSSMSEVSTIQLEFRDLARSSGFTQYEKVVSKVSEHLHKQSKMDGLVPMFINAETGEFRSHSTITLGARCDSYYEYLLKQWLQTGKTVDYLRDDYNSSISGIMTHLVRESSPSQLTFVGELMSSKQFKPKMDHLVCFLPGLLALGHFTGGLPMTHLELAEKLLYTCYYTYTTTETGLAPEITHFNLNKATDKDLIVMRADSHNLLRPETVESLWYLYHFTGNKTYQDWGWEIFESFNKYTRVRDGGYSAIDNVNNRLNPQPRDIMDSFFLAETLKYFYLLFSDDQDMLPLEKWVFNTEGHPLPIYT